MEDEGFSPLKNWREISSEQNHDKCVDFEKGEPIALEVPKE